MPLRNPSTLVASQVDVTTARLSGDWVVVQGAGLPVGTQVRIASDQMRTMTPTQTLVTSFVARGQGRYETEDGPLWVHWLDGGNRTAAIGDPAGNRVWIMDRTSASSPDRIQAAREILDWYGYDLTRLDRQ
ncbi:lipocalin family protein [Puniceibacterium sediminis]|uniref:Apolipoprotein D and lipocalin family protein n=1 Tax=Puniceibacterium sediminis TaxID=1608407 RepID=A0A238UZ12_9RHOB|nr:lipocalin family protein [Puniceibacterium sediminis]SNR27256.1 apolipoprotein D and lipocalin family protein [Puniceibacterium sediminis]